MDVANSMTFGGLMAIFGAFMALSLVAALAIYIYIGFAMMSIAKKLKKENAWLVWIPIVNFFYIPVMAGYKWYYGFLSILTAIPFIGWVIGLALTIWWFWKISEGVNKPGWFGILMAVPIANLIIPGILAWSK